MGNDVSTSSCIFDIDNNYRTTITCTCMCLSRYCVDLIMELLNSCLKCHIKSTSTTGTQNTTIIFVSAVIVIVIAAIRLFMELFQFLRPNNTIEYFKDLSNLVEVILFSCAILFAFVFLRSCYCPTSWQWQVGVVAVFLAWIDLIIFLRKIPLTGTFTMEFEQISHPLDCFEIFW